MMDADNKTVQMLMDIAELDQPHTFIPPHNEPVPLIHPLVEHLEYKEAALEVLMQSIFEICNCDYLISTCATDSSDMRLNLSFANRLDLLSTNLVGLSQNCKDAANDIQQKVRDAEDRKIAAEGILEISKRVENLEDKDPLVQTRSAPPKPFTKSKNIKPEPAQYLMISDSDSDIEDLMDWQVKQKENQPVFPGDPDTRFLNPKQNSNKRFDYDHFCETCKATFWSKKDLRNHQGQHTTEFYTCMHCLRKFRSLRSMENHMGTHSGKRYKCNRCDADFELKTSLDNHKAVHMTMIAHCPQEDCLKPFRSRASYLNHVKYGHLPTKTVPCPKCKHLFQSTISMMSHRVKKHGKVKKLVRGYTMM